MSNHCRRLSLLVASAESFFSSPPIGALMIAIAMAYLVLCVYGFARM